MFGQLEAIQCDITCPQSLSHLRNALRRMPACERNTISNLLNNAKAKETNCLGGLANAAAPTAANEPETKFDRFAKFACSEMKELEPDGRGRTNYVASNGYSHLVDNFNGLSDIQRNLKECLNESAFAGRAPTSATALTLKDAKELFQKMMLESGACCPAARPGGDAGNNGTKKSGGSGNGREVKMKHEWHCPTHGANLSHGRKIDGNGYKKCKKPGPGHKDEATFQNPMGGNTKRSDKAGKFWVGTSGTRGGRAVDS